MSPSVPPYSPGGYQDQFSPAPYQPGMQPQYGQPGFQAELSGATASAAGMDEASRKQRHQSYEMDGLAQQQMPLMELDASEAQTVQKK
jgi:hypothetical protein